MFLAKIVIFIQITGILGSHKDCGKPLDQRGESDYVYDGEYTTSERTTGLAVDVVDHPWTVSLVIEEEPDYYDYPDAKKTNKLHCTGSILDERRVLTAAHCFVNNDGRILPGYRKKIQVLAGANEPTNENYLEKNKANIQMKRIKNIKIHDRYDRVDKQAYYDIAIVELRGRFSFKENVWPICIPEKAESNKDAYKNTEMTLLGYGPAKKGEILTLEQLTVQGSDACNARYTVKPFDLFSGNIETALPNLFNDDSIMCAQKPGQQAGTCAGDSGGPLIVEPPIADDSDSGSDSDDDYYEYVSSSRSDAISAGGSERYVQKGLVHGSIKNCDGTRFPSIFIRLDNYMFSVGFMRMFSLTNL